MSGIAFDLTRPAQGSSAPNDQTHPGEAQAMSAKDFRLSTTVPCRGQELHTLKVWMSLKSCSEHCLVEC